MTRRNNVNGWVEYVHDEWMFSAGKESSLLASSQIIVDKMRDALATGRQGDVWYFIERLKKLSDLHRRGNESNRRTEHSETLLECGVVAYRIGNTEEALLLLDEAIGGFTSDGHFRAVAIWIKSCVQWLLPSRVEEAISGWERSRKLFERLGTQNSLYTEWYGEHVQEMRRAIDAATENDGILPYTETLISVSSPQRASQRRDALRMYPVYGQIPAGLPLTVDLSTAWLEIDEVVLGEERYRIINLVGNEQIVALQNNQRYYLLEVVGNSMNSSVPEPINHGDYVLMRNQNTANNQDIIAAEIVGIDESRATLKRYKKDSSNRILLLPESNDFRFQTPIYLEREFSEFDSDFSIRGIAIAVFKKIVV